MIWSAPIKTKRLIEGRASDLEDTSLTGCFGPGLRLRKAQDFTRVFNQPKRSSSRTVTVLARANGTDTARLGLAVAKKHVRRAVDRNRVKRLVRDYFRRHNSRLRGLDVVVLARRGIDGESNAEMRAQLELHWQRLCKFSPTDGS